MSLPQKPYPLGDKGFHLILLLLKSRFSLPINRLIFTEQLLFYWDALIPNHFLQMVSKVSVYILNPYTSLMLLYSMGMLLRTYYRMAAFKPTSPLFQYKNFLMIILKYNLGTLTFVLVLSFSELELTSEPLLLTSTTNMYSEFKRISYLLRPDNSIGALPHIPSPSRLAYKQSLREPAISFFDWLFTAILRSKKQIAH